ncbi:MAG: sugar transferase [Armatimonadetes bacterium]|nr:sugar transferase [Armatimonadota bacterium]
MDLALSLLVVAVAWPLLLVLALLVRGDSPGPVLFQQERVGLRGRRFLIYKFRTMRLGAEAELPELREAAGLPGPVFKLRDDPRVTRLGRLLRRTGLDELPQLWNVLRGEMSLVGPRPLPPDQVDWDDPRFRLRCEVLPGLTGLWQVSGRVMHVDYDRWLGIDAEYVARRCLRLDLEILLRTIPAVIRGNGAY